MNPIAQIMLFTSIAGLAMAIGAALASIENLRSKWLEQEFRHAVIAFGGGVLLAAVALVLVPDGAENLPIWGALPAFLAGGLAFFVLDRTLAAWNTSASQLVAMLADFIPEALALGAAYASGRPTGLLLAILITLQNLPEGFNAYREMVAGGKIRGRSVILALLLLAPLGPASGLAGYLWLADFPEAMSAIMLFAAGGILYLTFQDIAPQAKLRHAYAPPIGAVAGFALGLAGHMLIAGSSA